MYFAAESRIGRQPNAIKHATFLELSQIKCAKGITSSSNDSFPVAETNLNLMETGRNDASVKKSNDSPDFTVSASHDGQKMTEAWAKRRRRSTKVTSTGINDINSSSHYLDSTQPYLSPVELKQETLSPLECDTNELLEEFGVALDQDFNRYYRQQPFVVNYIEQDGWTTELNTRGSDGVDNGVLYYDCSQAQPMTSDFQSTVSSSSVPRPDPGIAVPQQDCVHTTVPVPVPVPSRSLQPDYEDVVRCMQQAYYNLLPILHRVCSVACLSDCDIVMKCAWNTHNVCTFFDFCFSFNQTT